MLAAAGAITYLMSNGNGPTFRGMLAPSTTIEQLLKGPRQYDGKIVKVDGMVVGSFGILGLGGFRLQDPQSGGEILVLTSGGIPPAGTPILVFGKFKQAVAIGSHQYAVILHDF
jgi:hypothetical protein